MLLTPMIGRMFRNTIPTELRARKVTVDMTFCRVYTLRMPPGLEWMAGNQRGG